MNDHVGMETMLKEAGEEVGALDAKVQGELHDVRTGIATQVEEAGAAGSARVRSAEAAMSLPTLRCGRASVWPAT